MLLFRRFQPGTLGLALMLALVALSLVAPVQAQEKDRTQTRPAGERVAVPLEIIRVGDGDTVTLRWGEEDTERVRILGIDTPEVAHPHWGQYQGQPFGTEAAAFAAGAFAAAAEVQLLRAAETDGYGRTLGYFFLNGKNFSVLLLQAGMAVETVSHYGDNGFPEISEDILAAARAMPPRALRGSLQVPAPHARDQGLGKEPRGRGRRGTEQLENPTRKRPEPCP